MDLTRGIHEDVACSAASRVPNVPRVWASPPVSKRYRQLLGQDDAAAAQLRQIENALLRCVGHDGLELTRRVLAGSSLMKAAGFS